MSSGRTRMEFSQSLLAWYAGNKRKLPWRDSPTPYHVLVSEIMLQQTQVSRVIEKFTEFTGKFPTLRRLANASRAEVIKAWSGLGYNRRALLLHRFAQAVVSDYGGKVPGSSAELCKLPGIGPYTAGAIASFAYNKPEPAIDVNVRRIYRRFFDGVDIGLPQGKKEEEKLYDRVKASIPQGKSRIFHNALMDFGSMVCTRDAPRCDICQVQKSCRFYPAFHEEKSNALFVMEKRKEPGVYEKGKFIPHRIFRGRLVEFARTNGEKEIRMIQLGRAIKKDFRATDTEWLLMLLQKLRNEALLGYSMKNKKIILTLG